MKALAQRAFLSGEACFEAKGKKNIFGVDTEDGTDVIDPVRARFVFCLFEEKRGNERGAEDKIVDDVVDVSLIYQENVVGGSRDFGMFVAGGEEMFTDFFRYRFVPRRDRGLGPVGLPIWAPSFPLFV